MSVSSDTLLSKRPSPDQFGRHGRFTRRCLELKLHTKSYSTQTACRNAECRVTSPWMCYLVFPYLRWFSTPIDESITATVWESHALHLTPMWHYELTHVSRSQRVHALCVCESQRAHALCVCESERAHALCVSVCWSFSLSVLACWLPCLVAESGSKCRGYSSERSPT